MSQVTNKRCEIFKTGDWARYIGSDAKENEFAHIGFINDEGKIYAQFFEYYCEGTNKRCLAGDGGHSGNFKDVFTKMDKIPETKWCQYCESSTYQL